MAKKMSTYEKFALANILIGWGIHLFKVAMYCLSGLGLVWIADIIFKLELNFIEFLFSSGIATALIYPILYQFFRDWKKVRTLNYVAGGALLFISTIIKPLFTQPIVVVMTNNVNIRPCPSSTDCQSIGIAQRGDQFEILGAEGAFYWVKYGNGVAYISSSPEFTRRRD